MPFFQQEDNGYPCLARELAGGCRSSSCHRRVHVTDSSRGDLEEESTSKSTCNEANTAVAVRVDPETKQARFVCAPPTLHLWPPVDSDGAGSTYFKDDNLNERGDLAASFGEGSRLLKHSTRNGSPSEPTVPITATLTIGTLPETLQVIYFACGADAGSLGESSEEGLSSGSPSGSGGSAGGPGSAGAALAGGGQGSSHSGGDGHPGGNNADEGGKDSLEKNTKKDGGSSLNVSDPEKSACTTEKRTMELDVNDQTKSVDFKCDTNISSLSPPNSATTVYDGSCEKELSLEKVLPTAKVESTDSGYTFRVDQLPPTSTTVCYKCSASAAQTEKASGCAVHIKVAGAASSSAVASSSVLYPVLVSCFCLFGLAFL
ncbi:SAG-related sequence [Besnoitia besnoiti]|uniref:SAG-related sequence n=1 Tax=Besnoitia besnoiti TaxID=94643 RepID=A0A2A9MEA1_BESBE|nr:SAG-related sequence [Besnoitia besnoiti]PFH33710.1 SAG-related sequence [Besnoitia besnoiti]